MVSISTPVCVNFELRPGAGDIHICWVFFNFDALAQGNAYKPTKEPINYRGPGGDRTHDLQTEATPPAHTYIHTYIRTYIHTYIHTHIHTYIHTYIHAYIHTYIHICWFNFDALAQGSAYKPTKEPINYRGPGGDRTHDLQTEATTPAASCPARSLNATEIVKKNTIPVTCPRLRWTTDNPSGMHRCQFPRICLC